MKKMLLILFVIVISFPVFSQQGTEGTSVNRGNIYTTDSEVIEGQYIVFLKDSIEFYLENSETRYVLGLDQVNEVQEYGGNYGTTGMLVGSLVGVGIGLAVALGSESSSSSNLPGLVSDEDLVNTVVVPLLAVTLGGVIGYFIGQGIEDWNTVYSKSTAFLKNFNIKQNKHTGLALSYKVYF